MNTAEVRHGRLSRDSVSTELVGLRRGELAGGNLVLEENVELAESAVLGLGESEEAVDDHQRVHSRPEEA